MALVTDIDHDRLFSERCKNHYEYYSLGSDNDFGPRDI
jgi:hypothetical protein